MTLAYDYPLLGIFWTILAFSVLVTWVMALFYVLLDLFRSDDLNGLATAMWVLFVLVVPFLGVFTYLVARGNQMAQRSIDAAQSRTPPPAVA